MNRRNALKTIGTSALALFGFGASDVTTPIQHGFPDWNRSVAAADIQIQNSLALNLTALTQTSVFFVGHMPYMYVRISSTNSANVGISWFADSAGTISLFGDVITTAVGGDGIQCIPIRGPYVRFTLERGAYPGTVNFQAFMVPVPFNVYAGTDGENNLIDVDGSLVLAATTATFNATATRGGWVHWSAQLNDGLSYISRLYSVDFTGVTHLIDSVIDNNSRQGGLVYAPALPLRVTIVNAEAIDRSAFVSVVHHPFYP